MKEAVGWVSGVVTGRGCGVGRSEATNEEFKLMPRGNALQTLQIHRERIATHHVNCMFPLDCLFVADPGRLVFL